MLLGPLFITAVDDFEVGAAAAVDPNAAAIETPGTVENAVVPAALANQEHTFMGVHLAPVAAAIVGCAIDQRGSLGGPITSDAEIRPATAIHPDPAAAITPGLAENAWRAAALADQAHSAACVHRTNHTTALVGRAINVEAFSPAVPGDRPDGEFRAAAVIHPNPAVIVAPSAVIDARSATQLADQFDSSAGIHRATVTALVV